jgi:PhnB protein
MAKVDPIPSNYPRLTPYLSVDGAAKAIDFYCDIFGATVRGRMDGPDGKVAHAELDLGPSLIMLSDTMEGAAPAPTQLGGSPVTMMVYVEDVDDVFTRAIKSGSKEIAAVKDQFYGDRAGQFEDPFGHRWNVASHIEDVPDDEMEKRAIEFMSAG